MKSIIKVSKVSAKNIIKNFRRLKSLVKKHDAMYLSLLTVAEKTIKEMIRFVESFLSFWG